MLHFNWPSEWNRPFVASLEKNIENAISAQMNKKTLSFIHGKPIVKELRLGVIPPRLALKHIHCLTPSRISLSVAFEYAGDASISLSGVSLNLDTTIISPAGAGVGIGGGAVSSGAVKGNFQGATGGNVKGSSGEVGGSNGLAGGSGVDGLAAGGMPSPSTDEQASHMPFLLPLEITLSCIRLAGSVDIEITQTFVYGINYFSFQRPQPTGAAGAENTVQQLEKKADDGGPKASKKRKNTVKSKTMPMSAVVQSLAFTAPSLSSMMLTDRKRSALIQEADNIQGLLGGGREAGKSSDTSAHAKAVASSSVCPPPRGPSLPLSPSDHFLPSDSGDSEAMAYSQSHLGFGMAMGGTNSLLGGFLQRGPSPHAYGQLTNNNVSMSSFRIGQASASSLGLGAGRGSRYPLLASSHIQVRGRGGVGRGRGIIRRPDAEEARTGVVSRQQVPARHVVLASSSPSPPAPYPTNMRMQGEGGGVDLFPAAGVCTLSTDSPTTCGNDMTNRKECLRSGKRPSVSRTLDGNNQALASVRNVLRGIGRLYFPFWAFLKPPNRQDSSFSGTQGTTNTSSAPQVTAASESQSLSTTNSPPQRIALNVKSFLDAYAFKKYARLGKGEKSEAGNSAVLTGGTRVRILFFTDPIKSFSLETNFTSIGVDKTLEHLVRTRALKPAIETLLANGLSFIV